MKFIIFNHKHNKTFLLKNVFNFLKQTACCGALHTHIFKIKKVMSQFTDGLIVSVKGNMGHAQAVPNKKLTLAIFDIFNRDSGLLNMPLVSLTYQIIKKLLPNYALTVSCEEFGTQSAECSAL